MACQLCFLQDSRLSVDRADLICELFSSDPCKFLRPLKLQLELEARGVTCDSHTDNFFCTTHLRGALFSDFNFGLVSRTRGSATHELRASRVQGEDRKMEGGCRRYYLVIHRVGAKEMQKDSLCS